MMTQLASGKTFDHARAELAAGHPWLSALRRAGADRFASVGYPKSTDEDWRLTQCRANRQNEIRFRPGASG